MLLRDKDIKRERASGVLMHIASLPSQGGIGDFGAEAYDFVDFLKKSGQKYWQILPLCPVGRGNAPYSSSSAFAGEILFISLDMLARDGYLNPDDITQPDFGKNTDCR